MSVLSLSGVVSSLDVPGGGEGMDEAIIAWLREDRGLLVGRPSAERLKIELGAACDPDPRRSAVVKGRCLRRGVPRAESVTAVDVSRALASHVDAIAQAIRRAVEQAPPELASDIVDQGVVLTGGGARLANLDLALRDRTGLPVVCADRPERAVVAGVGRVLDEPALQAVVAHG